MYVTHLRNVFDSLYPRLEGFFFLAFDQAYSKDFFRPKVCSEHNHGAYMTFPRASRRALSLFLYRLYIEHTTPQTLIPANDTPFEAFPRTYLTGYESVKKKTQ